MWEGTAYDQPLTVEELQELGWRCRAEQFEMDSYSGACGPRMDPPFSVFGIPSTASTLFLEDGALRGMNIGIHATAAVLLAKHLQHDFGSPQRSMTSDGCVLTWSHHKTYYRLYLSDEVTDGYTSLFIQLETPFQPETPESKLSRLWGQLRGTPCGKAPG